MMFSFASEAEAIKELFMPGPLIQGHAKFESECSKCHDLFQKASQNEKCIDCHKEVGKDVADEKGFHGRSVGLADRQCQHCHTDHEGRGFDVVLLDGQRFDHRVTDFQLKGAHKRTNCAKCHPADKKHREAPSLCFDCHKSDDPHRGRLGKKCADCHNEKTWRKGKFDHSKTKFPLKGKHRAVACDGCHPNQRFKKTPKLCVSCHSLDDYHAGNFGKKCETCHGQSDWKKSFFDHDKKTKFPLKGKHVKQKCQACHKGQLYREKNDKVKQECVECHRNDDSHKGRLGVKCEKCHTPDQWQKTLFNHDRDTKFKLVGRHVRLDCDSCHKGNAFKEKVGKTCYACHKSDDVHKGQEGKKCGRCHNQQGWSEKVKFDHEQTRFPLIGLHSIATCEECHLSATFKEVKSECADCHAKDDFHKKSLGSECGTCHSSNGWEFWEFDHNIQSDFLLKASHQDLKCGSCHTKPVKQKFDLPMTCFGCHESDDVHKGQEGKNCGRCHNETTWSDKVRFDHDLTRFPLIGIHAITTCEECHLSTTFKEVKTNCDDCHRKDDVHKKRLGPECAACHNPNGWALWRFDHNTETKFPLKGSHEGLQCEACHSRPVDRKIELPKTCFSCHKADDIHRGRFSRRCQRCHDTTSFKNVRFRLN